MYEGDNWAAAAGKRFEGREALESESRYRDSLMARATAIFRTEYDANLFTKAVLHESYKQEDVEKHPENHPPDDMVLDPEAFANAILKGAERFGYFKPSMEYARSMWGVVDKANKTIEDPAARESWIAGQMEEVAERLEAKYLGDDMSWLYDPKEKKRQSDMEVAVSVGSGDEKASMTKAEVEAEARRVAEEWGFVAKEVR